MKKQLRHGDGYCCAILLLLRFHFAIQLLQTFSRNLAFLYFMIYNKTVCSCIAFQNQCDWNGQSVNVSAHIYYIHVYTLSLEVILALQPVDIKIQRCFKVCNCKWKHSVVSKWSQKCGVPVIMFPRQLSSQRKRVAATTEEQNWSRHARLTNGQWA